VHWDVVDVPCNGTFTLLVVASRALHLFWPIVLTPHALLLLL
jgi:hypothetical protein